MTTITAQRAKNAIEMALALTRAEATRTQTTVATRFQQRYFYKPEDFMLDCVEWPAGEAPTQYQLEAGPLLLTHKRFSERAPHGVGKTTTVALLILWYALTRDGNDWKIPTTASSWRQLTFYLWPEIHKWAYKLRWNIIGRPPFNERTELKGLSLKLHTGVAFAAASDKPSSIEGAHADHILYVFDEAKTIPAATFDAAEGALSGDGEALAIAFSTPGPPQGRFYDIHSRAPGYEDWHVRHVTKEEAIDAGRLSPDWLTARAKQWGATSAVYLNRCEGQFASSEQDVVIPVTWVIAAQERWKARTLTHLTRIGADIAGSGENDTVFALRHGFYIDTLRKFSLEDTMTIAGRIKGILDKFSTPDSPTFQPPSAIIDIVGIGAGVYDRLREQGAIVEPFTAQAMSARYDSSGELGFVNRRSAAWWHMRDLLNPDNHHPIELPPDEDLRRELSTPLWKVTSGAKIQIESKEDISKRLDGRSTDSADAVIMAFDDDDATIRQLDPALATALSSHTGTGR